MDRTVAGYFRDRSAADRAFEALTRAGFSRDDISVMGRGTEGKAGLADDHVQKDVGPGEGAVTGGIVGLLLGAAAMLIPGIGPVVAIGPLSAALAGAITGGVTGAVVGAIAAALIHMGLPEEEARFFEDRLRQGGYLLTVRADEARYDEARRILEAEGAETYRGSGKVDDREPVRRASADTASERSTAATASSSAGDWASAMPTYRNRWQQRSGSSGGRWEDHEPVYPQGWQKRNDPQYRGQSWTQAEPELRREWEAQHDMPWEEAGPIMAEMWVMEVTSTPSSGRT